MANITVTHTFVNGTTADGTEINTNFSDIVNGTSDGTKDFSINALTCAGTATLNGNVVLGNATGDTITPNGRFAADIDPSADNARDLGASGLAFKAVYSYDFFASTGAVGTPSIAADGDTDTGLFWSAANVLNVACGGAEVLELDGTSIDATVDIITSTNMQAVDFTATDNFKASLGAVGSPSFTFTGDLDSGFWSSAANTLNFSAGATEILELDTTSADFTVAVNTSAGLTADGACTFNESGAAVDFRVEGDTDANLFFVDGSADNVGFGTNGPLYKAEVIDSTSKSQFSWGTSTNEGGWLWSNGVNRAGILGSCSHDGTNYIARHTEASSIIFEAGATVFQNNASLTDGNSFTPTITMKIDSSGNVGIGTTGPTTLLHLLDGSSTVLTIDRDTGTGNAILRFSENGSEQGTIRIDGGDSDKMKLRVSGTDAITIDSSQNVGIGTTSPGHKLHVAHATADEYTMEITPSSNALGLHINSSATTARQLVRAEGGSVVSYESFANGTFNTNSGSVDGTTSDERLKTNYRTITDALSTLCRLQPKYFDWKCPENHTEKTKAGFVAQEIELVRPDWVQQGNAHENELKVLGLESEADTILTTRFTDLNAYLVKAIQELKAEVDQLKAS